MKKNLAKVLASASFVVALILIVILLVAAFGGIKEEDFNNGLVHGLLIAISVLYLLVAGLTITLLFAQGEALHEIIVKNGKGESVRVSSSVVKKEIKKACHMIEGVKFKKIALLGDGFGVTLKLSIKVSDKDIDEVEIATRCYIEDCMAKTFSYHFNAIDINIMQLVPKYKADEEQLNAEVQRQLEERRAEEERAQAEQREQEELHDARREEIRADLAAQNDGSAETTEEMAEELAQESETPAEEAELVSEESAESETPAEEAEAEETEKEEPKAEESEKPEEKPQEA